MTITTAATAPAQLITTTCSTARSHIPALPEPQFCYHRHADENPQGNPVENRVLAFVRALAGTTEVRSKVIWQADADGCWTRTVSMFRNETTFTQEPRGNDAREPYTALIVSACDDVEGTLDVYVYDAMQAHALESANALFYALTGTR